MTSLETLWPELASIPRHPIATLPTAVEQLGVASNVLGTDVWCKRDDRTASAYGGNKVRKLEYLIGDAVARGCDAIVTTGALGSHHVLATAIHAAQAGLDVEAVMVPQPWSDHVHDNLRADLAAGATLHRARNMPMAALAIGRVAARLRGRRRRPYVVPPGGSSSVGCLGYVRAGIELAVQIDDGVVPRPDAIYAAAGSGSTVAGLSLGLCAGGHPTIVVAVRSTSRRAINRLTLGTLVHRTERRLRAACAGFPRVASHALACIEIDARQFGSGYGHATEAGAEADDLARRDGLTVDPTYTAKALAALVADARGTRQGKRLLFLQTLSSADLGPLLRDAPPPAPWALKLATIAS